jgi:WD40 repeat protein
MLATIPETGPISLWDTATGERRGELATDGDEAFTALAFSRDSDMVATGDEDGTVLLWDLATLTPIGAPLGKHDNFVQALAFSPDGKTLVSTAWTGPTFVWDTETRMPLGRIDPGESIPADVRFSPDDARIVLIGNDGAIHEWDRVSLQRAGEPMNGGVGPLWTAAYSPDGQTLASVGYAGQVVLWDVAERAPIGEPLLAPGGDVASLAFRPDGSTLVAVDGEEQAIAFAVSVEDWTAYACAIANRNLTQEEWEQYLGERPYHQTCPDTPVPAPGDFPATPVVSIAG